MNTDNYLVILWAQQISVGLRELSEVPEKIKDLVTQKLLEKNGGNTDARSF